MTPTKALKLIFRFQEAISLLTIHGCIPDSQREKLKDKLDVWASKNGLRRKNKGVECGGRSRPDIIKPKQRGG